MARLEELNAKAEDPGLWNDTARAQVLMRERTRLQASVGRVEELERAFQDTVGLLELAEGEGDEGMIGDAMAELARLRDAAAKRRLESLLSGEADGNDAYLEVHAGAGGTESQDWAEMLLRMYARWAEQNG